MSLNELLPYSQDVRNEQPGLLAEIMAGLEDTAEGPGDLTGFWSRLLTRYLDLKYKFSPEDAAIICRVILSFMVKPDVDPVKRTKWASLLSRLLRKQKREELRLDVDWRSLYDLLKKTHLGSVTSVEYVGRTVRDAQASALIKLIRKARKFFAPSAAEEIWAELRPRLCPHDDNELFRSVCVLSLFLPTESGDAWWVPEALSIWDWIDNSTDWDVHFTLILARLTKDAWARRAQSAIPWASALPRLLSRVLEVLELPVGSGRGPKIDRVGFPSECAAFRTGFHSSSLLLQKAAKFIVYLMMPHPNNTAQEHLDRLLRTTLTFFHPSNGGSWTSSLGRFMQSLCEFFAQRINLEHSLAAQGTPHVSALGGTEIRHFVSSLLPAINLAIYSKSSTMCACANQCVKTLAYLLPDDVLAPLIATKIYPALGLGDMDDRTILATHQTLAALETLSVCAHAIFSSQNYPRGAQHIIDLLHASLPGVDANDAGKTRATLRFFLALLYTVPLVEASSSSGSSSYEGGDVVMADVDGEEGAARQATFEFGEWSLALLQRLWQLLTHIDKPAGKGHDAQEQWEAGLVQRVGAALFHQVSEGIYTALLDKLCSLLTQEVLPNARKQVGFLVSAAVAARPSLSFPKLLTLITRIALDDSVHEDRHAYFLHMLGQAVRFAPAQLVQHRDALARLWDKLLRDAPKKVLKEATKVLRYALHALTQMYPLDWRSINEPTWRELDSKGGLHWRHWGTRYEIGSTQVAWHVPSPEEVKLAREWTVRYLTQPLDVLRQPTAATRDQLWRSLQVVRNLVRGSAALLDDFFPPSDSDVADATTDDGRPPRRPAFPQPVRCGQIPPPADPSIAAQVPGAMHELCGVLLTSGSALEGDLPAIGVVIKTFHLLLNTRGGHERNNVMAVSGGRTHAYKYFKSALRDRLNGRKLLPRSLIVERAYLQHLTRLVHNAQCVRYTPLRRTLILDLLRFSTHPYSKVRKSSQQVLLVALKRYPPAATAIVPVIIEMLRERPPTNATPQQLSEVEDRVTGACWLLTSSNMMKRVTRDWALTRSFMLALADTAHHQKLSLQGRLVALFMILAVGSRPIAIRSSEQSATHDDLLNSILTKLETASTGEALHWRYQVMHLSFLVFLLRRDMPHMPRTMRCLTHLLVSDLPPIRQIALIALCKFLAMLRRSSLPNKHLVAGPPEDYSAAMAPDSPLLDGVYNGWFASFPDTRPVPLTPLGGASSAVREAHDALLAALSDPQFSTALVNIVAQDHHYEGEQQDARGSPASVMGRVMHMMSGGGSSIGDLVSSLITPRAFRQVSRSEAFVAVHAELFKGVAANLGAAGVHALWPHVERMAASAADRDHQVTTIEMLAGFVRGTKRWTHDHAAPFRTNCLGVLRRCLDNAANVDIVADCMAALRYCVASRDPRRVAWLTSDLFASAAPHNDPRPAAASPSALASDSTPAPTPTVSRLSNRLKFVQPVLEELSWKSRPVAQLIIPQLADSVGHPFKQVREEVGRTMSFLLCNAWEPPVVRCTAAAPPAPPTLTSPTTSGALTQFFQHLDATLSRMQLDEDAEDATAAVLPAGSPAPESLQSRERTQFREGVLFVLIHTIQSGGAKALAPYLIPLLPHLLSFVRKQSKQELCAQAAYCLALLSQTRYGASQLQALVDTLHQVARESQVWHVRASILPYISLFTYRHFFLLPTNLETTVASTVFKLSQDPQLDVRELAGTALATLLRIPLSTSSLQTTALISSFMRASTSKDEVQRHAAVLGLIAVVHSSPYDVPDWMPPVVVKVAAMARDSSAPVRVSVRKGMAEFKRTHSDTWATDKHKFDSDDLLALNDVMLSPNYYA